MSECLSNYETRQEWKQLINNVTVYTMLQIYWPGVTSGSVHLDLTTQESDAAERGLEDLSVARSPVQGAWREEGSCAPGAKTENGADQLIDRVFAHPR